VENSFAICAARAAIGVHDADEFGAGKLAIHAGMIPPEISRAHHRHADFFPG
jgi:hypothetical protein